MSQTFIPFSYSPIKTSVNSHNKITANPGQTHVSPVLTGSVSVSPCELRLADSVDRVLLLSSILSNSYNLFSPSSVGFPDIQGDGWTLWRSPIKIIIFQVSKYGYMVICIYFHLLLEEVSDGNWTRHHQWVWHNI